MLQTTLNASALPNTAPAAQSDQKAEITEESIRDDEIIDQSNTIPDFELPL